MAESNDFLRDLVQDRNINVILNSIYDGVYIVDRDREILLWNQGAERITGYLGNDVLHHHCADDILNHIDANGCNLCNTMCPLMESILKDKTTEAIIYPLNKEKKRFPVLTRVGPIKDHNGKIVGAIEVFRDISKEEDLRILQEKFNQLIKRFVSTSTYEQVTNEARSGKPNDTVLCDMTIVYVDIAGFMSFSLRNNMIEIARLLNEVFGLCEIITKEFHGDIDKFIGDAIMATFRDANDAVKAAEKILAELKSFNEQRQKNGHEIIELHIGINSGQVIRAEIGTAERKDLTVLGDAVNIASRIEEMSEPGSVFISESTYSRLRNNDNYAYYNKIAIKERKEPIGVYRSINRADN